MKKINIALLIALAVSGTAMAQLMSETFGYTTITTPAAGGLKIVNIAPFGDGTAVDIQDALKLDGMNATADWSTCDQMIVWDGAYTTYGLYDDVANGTQYWMASGWGWDFPTLAAPAAVALPRGMGVWIKSGTAGVGQTMLDGLVYTNASETIDIGAAGISIIAYPFSSAINLTDLDISNATATADWSTCDQVIIWDGAYTTYGLYDDVANGTQYWMASGWGWDFPTLAAPSSVDIPLGQGFWFKTSGAKTIGFNTNY